MLVSSFGHFRVSVLTFDAIFHFSVLINVHFLSILSLSSIFLQISWLNFQMLSKCNILHENVKKLRSVHCEHGNATELCFLFCRLGESYYFNGDSNGSFPPEERQRFFRSLQKSASAKIQLSIRYSGTKKIRYYA